MNLAPQIRSQLLDPVALCSKLGLLKGARRQARGVMICCPVHGDRNPSCSVTGVAGGVRVKCFSCDWGGDALHLIARVHGLQTTGDQFREVLALGAEYAGDLATAQSIREGEPDIAIARPRMPRQRVFVPETISDPPYPDTGLTAAIWREAGPVSEYMPAVSQLLHRQIDPGLVEEMRLAKVLRPNQELPRWARFRGISWIDTHRVILPVWDNLGHMRSLRAWRTSGEGPKRLPPAGCKASGLVMANLPAVLMLRGRYSPRRVLIVEGEPDYLVAATDLAPSDAVIGIGSGSWTEEFAEKVCARASVVVASHADAAGDRYAGHVIETLRAHRAPIKRWRMVK